jgi:hypothetical protein
MYEAKRNGGAQWQFFENSSHRPLGLDQSLEGVLLSTAAENEEAQP